MSVQHGVCTNCGGTVEVTVNLNPLLGFLGVKGGRCLDCGARYRASQAMILKPKAKFTVPKKASPIPAVPKPAAAPDKATAIWFYQAENGDALGPETETQLLAHVSASKVRRNTLVWRVGFAKWLPAGETSELCQYVSKPTHNVGEREGSYPQPFASTCSQCREAVLYESKFCSHCGSHIPKVSPNTCADETKSPAVEPIPTELENTARSSVVPDTRLADADRFPDERTAPLAAASTTMPEDIPSRAIIFAKDHAFSILSGVVVVTSWGLYLEPLFWLSLLTLIAALGHEILKSSSRKSMLSKGQLK
jgi:hypothetical protein